MLPWSLFLPFYHHCFSIWRLVFWLGRSHPSAAQPKAQNAWRDGGSGLHPALHSPLSAELCTSFHFFTPVAKGNVINNPGFTASQKSRDKPGYSALCLEFLVPCKQHCTAAAPAGQGEHSQQDIPSPPHQTGAGRDSPEWQKHVTEIIPIFAKAEETLI